MNFVLARVSPPESQEECVSSLDSFKFDKSQSMKTFRNLEDLPLRPKVSTMKSLCRKANQSEKFYRCFFEDQWLRTAIVSPTQVHKKIDSDTRVNIHSNVLPSKAYLTRWQLTCAMQVDSSVCPADNFKGFFPVSLLEKCLREPSRIMDVDERSVDDGQWRSMESSSSECSEFLDLDLLRKELLEWIKERGAHQQQLHECHLASELQRCQNATNEYMPSRDRKSWSVAVSEVDSVRRLGSGAEGEVWKVIWNGGTFAMKVFNDETARNNEASIAFLVSHPHVVHYFGVSNPESGSNPESSNPESGYGRYRLFMELLDTDLYNFIDQRSKNHEPLFPTDKARLEVLLQIAQAMEHLHKENVVHGDLKPDNILLGWYELINPDEKYCLVKVADLGRAQRVESFRCSGGTTLYAAPEVLRWREQRKLRIEQPLIIEQPLKIDVYSFGIVVYQVLTGRLSGKEIYGVKSFTGGVMEGSLKPDLTRLSRYHPSLTNLVEGCLIEAPAQRLPFSEICSTIQSLIDEPPAAQDERRPRVCDQHSMIHLHPPGVCLVLSDSLILKRLMYMWFVSVIDISSIEGQTGKVRQAWHLRKYSLSILKTLLKMNREMVSNLIARLLIAPVHLSSSLWGSGFRYEVLIPVRV
jgi:serine/threonine protein kinase